MQRSFSVRSAIFAATLVATLLVAVPSASALDGPGSCNANDNGTKWGVTWTAVAPPIDQYVIERSLDAGVSWTERHDEQANGSDLQFGDSDNAAGARYRISARTFSPAALSPSTLCTANGQPVDPNPGDGEPDEPVGQDAERPATPKRPVLVSQGQGTASITMEHRGDNVGVATFHLYRNTVDDFAIVAKRRTGADSPSSARRTGGSRFGAAGDAEASSAC